MRWFSFIVEYIKADSPVGIEKCGLLYFLFIVKPPDSHHTTQYICKYFFYCISIHFGLMDGYMIWLDGKGEFIILKGIIIIKWCK